MHIRLKSLVPIPLRDKFFGRSSDIWNKDISFSPKSMVKIVAPSGTGKTTLMNTIYKLRSDYNGDVLYDNKNIRDIDDEALALIRQLKLSVVFQDLRLFEHLTGRENIELSRVLQQPYCDDNAIDEMAEFLGISHILNQPANICSYGEQQRIAIIRALVKPFEWLLMDEPFSHLDQANTAKAVALIERECNRRNAGFLLTDLDEDNLFNYTGVYKL